MGTHPVTGRAVRKHVRGKTKASVADKVRALEEARDGGFTGANADATLAEWLESWIESQVGVVRPKTVLGYRTDLHYVEASAAGKVRLSKLGPEHIELLWRDMRTSGVERSIPHARRTVSACLTTAVERGRLVRNPVKLAKTPTHETPKITPLDREQAKRAIAVARTKRNGVRWLLALSLGLRQGETLGLQEGDLDLDNGVAHLARQVYRLPYEHGCPDPDACLYPTGRRRRGGHCPQRFGGGLTVAVLKTDDSERDVPLAPQLVVELRVHLHRLHAEREAGGATWAAQPHWLFPNRDGGPMDAAKNWKEWQQILAEAGLPRARVHDTRHTSATTMLALGIDSRTVQDIHGWKSATLLQRYQHPVDELRRRAAATVGAAIL